MNKTVSSALVRRNGTPKYTVVPESGCWQWTASMDHLGYGRCALGGENYAHRASYVEVKGPISDGMTLDHLCRNRSCVNPEHLEAVPLAENIRRSPRSKLSADAVSEIRMNVHSLSTLARKYGVTKQAIYRIRRGLAWKT